MNPEIATAKSLIAHGLGVAFLSSGVALTAAPLITSLEVGETEVVLTYQDDGSSNDFDLEVNPGLDPANWSPITSPEITAIGGGKFRFRISRTAADKEFFRVVGRFLSTELDRDGDGIDNARETNEFGTDPDKFDTDGDGFSDATEIALGTDPKLASSFPELANFPAVDFAEPISSIEEGQGSQTITIIASPAYTGQISISVNDRSSAVQGVDYTNTSVPTSVFMSGGSATFDIDIIDDLEIRPSRMLILDVIKGADYRAAGSVTHALNISDNDAYWFGSIRDELTERSFRLCIVRDATTVDANFVSGKDDGLPDPDNGESSVSIGLIPDKDLNGLDQTIWPVGSITFDLETPAFSAVVTDLPSTNNGIITDSLVRTITLTSTPATEASHTVVNNLVSGIYTEQVRHATEPGTTYLNKTLTGVFTIMREIAPAPAINSPFNPLND